MRKFLLLSSILIFAVVCLGAVSSFYLVDDTTGEKIPFGTGGELHFENISGLPNAVTVFSADSIDTTPYDNHIADDTIHFAQTEIDHDNLLNVGTYGHDQLDAHVVDSTVHFLESSIDHTVIQNVGTYTHAQLDSHVDDSTIHFTQSEIDHDNLNGASGYSNHSAIDAFMADSSGNIAAHAADTTIHYTQSEIDHDNLDGASGYYNHSSIDAHIDDSTIHAPINDSLTTSTTELWSSDYTKDYVDDNSGGSASIPAGTIWMFAGSTAPNGWSICDGEALNTTTEADLFAVIGYTYGGSDSTFYEPDLRGRAAIGAGQGSGLSNRAIGDTPGEESHVLSASELPSKTMKKGEDDFKTTAYASGTNYNVATGDNLNTFGQDSGHNTMQPSLVINYIIKY